MGMIRLFSDTSKSNCCNSSNQKTLINQVMKENDPNPDPFHFYIRQIFEAGDYLVAMINYPNCTTYNGNKVLVYKGITKDKLKKQESLDPHFIDKKGIYPIARFHGNKKGWSLAIKFIQFLCIQNIFEE